MKSLDSECVRRDYNVRVSRCEVWAKRSAPVARLVLGRIRGSAPIASASTSQDVICWTFYGYALVAGMAHGCSRGFRPQIPPEISFCLYLSIGVVRISGLAPGLLLDHLLAYKSHRCLTRPHSPALHATPRILEQVVSPSLRCQTAVPSARLAQAARKQKIQAQGKHQPPVSPS